MMKLLLVLVVVLVVVGAVVEGRYLPTRGDDQRLEEIRSLLRDLIQGSGYAPRMVKREAAQD